MPEAWQFDESAESQATSRVYEKFISVWGEVVLDGATIEPFVVLGAIARAYGIQPLVSLDLKWSAYREINTLADFQGYIGRHEAKK